MAAIFVSYRRDDSRDIAGRLVDRLRRDFAADQLFLDIDTIPAGADFRAVLAERLDACDVLLAVIGPRWAAIEDAAGKRRLDDPNDHVRREIAAGLGRDDVRVVPVLVSGARMPRAEDLPDDLKPLVNRQSYELRYERFAADADGLVAQLSAVVRPRSRRRLAMAALALVALVGVAVYGYLHRTRSIRSSDPTPSTPVLRDEAIQLCKEASEVVARLTSTSNAEDWARARDRFWVLYNGPLYTIETKEKEKSPDGTSPLEGAMVRFGGLLQRVGDKPGTLPLNDIDFNRASLAVARACKDTVERM